MAETLELDSADVQELFFERGWTDGLPIVPPTPEAVERMLAAGASAPEDVLGAVSGRSTTLTAEALAVNAVMAGCRPEYFPVVLAAVGAMMDPAFNLNAALTSTGGAALCVVVSGPIALEIGLNSGHNVLGPGARANATIGRTFRLVALNVFDARPGGMDGSSIGNPGKYSLCLAEGAPPVGWETLREELGYSLDDSTVTVMATEGPRQVANHLNGTAQGILATLASAMRSPSTFTVGKGAQAILVLGPEHAAALADGGWSRRAVREHLAEATRLPPEELQAAGVLIPKGSAHDMTPGPDGKLPVVCGPDDVFLVTAGGAGAGWSAHLPAWASSVSTHAVTRRVRPTGEALPDCGPDSCAVSF